LSCTRERKKYEYTKASGENNQPKCVDPLSLMVFIILNRFITACYQQQTQSQYGLQQGIFSFQPGGLDIIAGLSLSSRGTT